MKRIHLIRTGIFLFLISAPFLLGISPRQSVNDQVFVPIGGGYSDIYSDLISIAAQHAFNKQVNILVFPVASASDPQTISESERKEKLKAAEFRTAQIEEACKIALPDMICSVSLAPILVNSDAQDPANLEYFNKDLSAIFILDGEPGIAMQVIGATPVEQAVEQAYLKGVPILGTGAGAQIQSSTMIAGYKEGFSNANSLEFGAVDVWDASSESDGLSFGVREVIFDEHFFQSGNPGRLINAITLPGVPHVGIGVDASTGVQIIDQHKVGNPFGHYTAAIFDGQTYHAAEGVRYNGSDHLLSLRNILVNLLASGDFSYDLGTRTSSLATPAAHLERSFPDLALPSGAGNLFLAGGLSNSLLDNPVLDRFVQVSGGNDAHILVIAAGYQTASSAQNAADAYASILGVPAQTLVILHPEVSAPLPSPESYTGILLVAKEQSILQPQLGELAFLKDFWLSGKPILADNAAAAALGSYFSAKESTSMDKEEAGIFAQEAFIQGKTDISRGLNFVHANLEPQLLNGNRWGQLFSLAYAHPELLAIGLSQNSAIEFSSNGVSVLGENVITSLDFSSAVLGLGENHAYVVANGLLDVFTPGDVLEPQTADINSSPIQAATPVIIATTPASSATPSITPTGTPEPSLTPLPPTDTPEPGKTTKTPKPTSTPPTIPPPSDSGKMNMMVGLIFVVAVIVIVGIMINKKRYSG